MACRIVAEKGDGHSAMDNQPFSWKEALLGMYFTFLAAVSRRTLFAAHKLL